MKTFNILLIIFWSQIVCSQTRMISRDNPNVVNIDTIDLDLLNKTLFDEMNKYRSSLGVGEVVFSDVCFKKISLITSKRMVEKKEVKHYYLDTDSVANEIAREIEKKYGAKVKRKDNGEIIWFGNFEICLSFLLREFSPNMSYVDLSKKFIEQWYNSPPHRGIMQSKHGYLGHPGIGSCSVSVDRKHFYVCFDFIILSR